MTQFLTASPEINVDEIMATVHRRIEERRRGGAISDKELQTIETAELQPLPDFIEVPSVYEDSLYQNATAAAPYASPHMNDFKTDHEAALARIQDELRSLQTEMDTLKATPFQPCPAVDLVPVEEQGAIKTILKALRRCFMPWLRFFSRPLYRELEKNINGLTNHIIDVNNNLQQFEISSRTDQLLARFGAALDLQHIQQKLYDQHGAIVDIHPIVLQSREYVKLLHNVASNTVSELTKLKIELEQLKTKNRVLEEKMEFLENRNRALEKRLTPP